jgi:hypothetical protein
MAKGVVGVPNPVALYGNTEALSTRDKLVMQFGEATVQWAEMACVIQLLFAVGIVKPNEFIELVQHQCQRTDDMRRRAAGFAD